MKYKLVNNKTKEEALCDKVTIDWFDYYVSDEKLQIGDYLQRNNDLPVLYTENFWFDFGVPYKKVIACNNPNINIPKEVEEVDVLRETMVNLCLEKIKDLTKRFFWKAGFKSGYNKSQETHPFSEEDMIDFAEFYFREEFNSTMQDCKPSKEILRLWKEQQPKIVYYE